ncbi:MAG: COX15/CtaA family protein [Gemmatimonadaceae bacterium]
MSTLRRLGWVALVLAFGQIVFGAIVRITGSGMGCGDSWPQCAGQWLPPLDRRDLVIEVTHRYIAAALTLVIVLLTAVAFVRRQLAGVGGPGGVLRPTLLAAMLVVVAALFGAATVKLELTNKGVIVTHLAIAMTLLAVLLVVIDRTRDAVPSSVSIQPRTLRATYAAVVLVFLTLVLGALTAHVPGANTACGGFPLCNGSFVPTAAIQHAQYTHRVLALLVVLHVAALAVGVTRRKETPLVAATRLTLAAVALQIVIAALLVELNLPLILRSLHEAVGTLIWLLVVWLTVVARRSVAARAAASTMARVGTTAEARA